MAILNSRISQEREQLAFDTVREHIVRIVVCTPSKIVFETKSAADGVEADKLLKEQGFSTELFDQRFLHARF